MGPTPGRMRKGLLIGLVAVIATLSGAAAWVGAGPAVAGWREIAWPFPRDGWPAGRAFRCESALCGQPIELYVRPKIGFCNCDVGVADDDEVDRVADLDLISPQFAADDAGRAVQLANVSGRMRSYSLQMPDGTRQAALGIALSRRCDLVVAAARGSPGSRLQHAVLDFLGKDDVWRWMTAALDSR
ncbi:hypothetical protein [uncultured Bradyrhizobium sp.]|uniref:hypothetical protein n=1 Tax=uncultured Bradyrhizobium sp. TaxID=199684 RepID=UPI0035CA17AF